MLPVFISKQARLVIRIVGVHRADHAQVVDVPGDVRKQLADLDAAFAVPFERERRRQQLAALAAAVLRGQRLGQRFARVLGQFGLGIERIDVRRPAVHEQEDEPLGPRGEVRGLGSERVDRGGF